MELEGKAMVDSLYLLLMFFILLKMYVQRFLLVDTVKC